MSTQAHLLVAHDMSGFWCKPGLDVVEAESTHTVKPALREVIERQELFRALYSDRASHFFETTLRRKTSEGFC